MPNNFTKKWGKRFVPDENKYLFNIDTFWYNADCKNYNQAIDELKDVLIEGRNFYYEHNEFLSITIPIFDIETEFQIQLGQPPSYAYSIRSNDIAIFFSNKKYDDRMPLKIQLNQFLLWEQGIEKSLNISFLVLSFLGFEIDKAQINRIDYAIHTDQFIWTYHDLKKFVYPNNFSNSSRPTLINVDLENDTFETAYFGSRKSQRRFLRIYNKSKEILDKHKYYFYDIYNKFDMDLENVWNIELEIRRNFIKDLQETDENGELIYIFNDLFYCINNNGFQKLFMYAIKDYELKNSAFWTTLINNKNNDFYIEGFNINRKKQNDWEKQKELAQIFGRLKKFVLYEEDYTLNDAIKTIYTELLEYEDEKKKDFKAEVEKLKRLNISKEIVKTIKKDGRQQIKWDHKEDE